VGIKNLGWFDSRHRLTGITPEQFDLGWPHCLSSADIATLQRPVPADRKGVQATFYLMGPVSNLWAAIASTCPTDHTGKIGAEIVHFHNAPAFAAWLAAQTTEPSKAIAAWFAAVGVNAQPQPEAAPLPTDEPIEDRGKRWLERYEKEVKTVLRGAYARGAAHFGEEASKYRKAVIKAKKRRAIEYRADIKAVPAKGGAGGWPSTLVEMGKKKKGTKA
jgi:hypothetical protein